MIFLEKYNENYETFYERSTETKIIQIVRYYSKKFDEYTKVNDGFFLFTFAVASYRGDLFTSDRECAAFVRTYDYYISTMENR